MRPILSASGTYNYNLAKWLDSTLKPLVRNEFMVNNTFEFVEMIKKVDIKPTDMLASFDVVSLFTNVPLDETIEFLVEKAFENDWFNKIHGLNLTKEKLRFLLEAATKNQLFQFNKDLYEQFDGVAMGSPLGPLMANAFMCKLESYMKANDLLPEHYYRYVDDTVAIFPSTEECTAFLQTLNGLHPSASFTCELHKNHILPFIGINLRNTGDCISTSVYRKPTDKGQLLHFHSHTDSRYKKAIIKTMLVRAFRVCSSWTEFHNECLYLERVFTKLQYPKHLVQNLTRNVLDECRSFEPSVRAEQRTLQLQEKRDRNVIRLVIPFKSDKLSRHLRVDLAMLSSRLDINIQPAFTAKKVRQLIAQPVKKDKLVSQSHVVYDYHCVCDAHYVGYTARHLHQRVIEHQNGPNSAIYKHCQSNTSCAFNSDNFSVLSKCASVFDCRVREAIEIYFRKPMLNLREEFRCTLLYRVHY